MNIVLPKAVLLVAFIAFSEGAPSGHNPSPLLFVDKTLFSAFDARLELRMNPPTKGPRVIRPTEPWESWAVFAYNHVLEVAHGDYRMYYDCIEGTGLPPGELGVGSGSLSHRRICLATSTDGVEWVKPALGIFDRNGSTANNILIEDSGVSVFLDNTAGVSAAERWKMVCSTAAYASPDGLHWTKLGNARQTEDDTKPTAYYDPEIKKYVIMVRRDISPPPNKSWSVIRFIGRCETTNLTDWLQGDAPGADGCPVVFGPDSLDPDWLDLYTNAWTPYPSIESPSVHLFFPSPYTHFAEGAAPFGFRNDGLLDIRLAVSRDGKKFSYPDARNGRSPFVPLGINTCGNSASFPSVGGGWCSPTSGVEAHTNFDTSAMYMASGYLSSLDGSMLYFYSSGQPFSHGGDSGKHFWGNNTGIRILTMRKDGFVSVDAPYEFPRQREELASFTTIPIEVPSDCSPAVINTSTSAHTSCGFKFKSGACEAPFTTVPCHKDDDCNAYANHPTCKGTVTTCDTSQGICRAPGATAHTGDLCVSKTTTNRTSGGVQLLMNVETSVAGFTLVEVQQLNAPVFADGPGSWEAVAGFGLQDADVLQGSSLSAAASWGHGSMTSLSSFAGKSVKLRVAMADSKLFALRLACADSTSLDSTAIVV